MLTVPAARRMGAGSSLLRSLALTALEAQMEELYLLVDADNAPARALYARAGFRDLYRYHYRVQPYAP
jgi:ribosomal protein S18 acetylase RimI-like enzyme